MHAFAEYYFTLSLEEVHCSDWTYVSLMYFFDKLKYVDGAILSIPFKRKLVVMPDIIIYEMSSICTSLTQSLSEGGTTDPGMTAWRFNKNNANQIWKKG